MMEEVGMICPCCVIMAYNGEECECAPEDHPEGIDNLDTSEYDVPFGESEFSMSPCWACGTYLAGTRHPITKEY